MLVYYNIVMYQNCMLSYAQTVIYFDSDNLYVQELINLSLKYVISFDWFYNIDIQTIINIKEKVQKIIGILILPFFSSRLFHIYTNIRYQICLQCKA